VQVRLPRGAKKERAKGRRIILEIDTDPALSYHVRKLDELLSSRSPTEPLRSMSRQELAEMSLFGHQLFQTGRLEEARVVFEGLVGLDIEDAFPHTMLGTVYLAMGRVDRAAALFEAALRIDPKDVAARVYRAELSLSQGELPRAVKALEAVVAEGPVSDPFVCRAQRLLEIARSGRRRK
jgi:Tfp pilus assembly protein PilF